MPGSDLILARIREFQQELIESKDIREIKSVRDKAEAVRGYAKSAKLGLDIQNRAAELKLRAERKAGRLLASMKLRGGDRRSNFSRGSLKLRDLGISQKESFRWQREAAVSEVAFELFLIEARQTGQEITSSSLLRLASRLGRGPRSNGTHHRKVKTRSCDGSSCELMIVSDLETLELAQEIHDHLQTLRSVVCRICQDRRSPVRKSDRQSLMRYTQESIMLLERILGRQRG